MKNKIAIYAGSFDPITDGHCQIINKALKIFNQIIIVIAENANKKYFLDAKEREKLILSVYKKEKEHNKIKVKISNNLTVHEAKNFGAQFLIRGLRAISDFDYEFAMYQTNKKLDKDIETVFLMPDSNEMFISSSMVRELLKYKVDIADFVPKEVNQYFAKKQGS